MKNFLSILLNEEDIDDVDLLKETINDNKVHYSKWRLLGMVIRSIIISKPPETPRAQHTKSEILRNFPIINKIHCAL